MVETNKMKNGKPWLDTDGQVIQAHGGCMLHYEGTYYWYGENKAGKTIGGEEVGCGARVDVIGVSCYHSQNLTDWECDGLVLKANPVDKESDLHPSKIVERPKVIYNPTTRKFVMFLHIDHADYEYARVGIAVSDSPTGEFCYLGSISPNGSDSRDFTVFQDKADAYLIYASEYNSVTKIAKLSPDYLTVTDEMIETFRSPNKHGGREAFAAFEYQGKYYILSSGCTGWDYNQAEIAVADQMLGDWKVLGNPCKGKNSEYTFGGQSTEVFYGKKGFVAMFDCWNPKDLASSGYLWLPISWKQGNPEIVWKEVWDGE